jgi:hypothetical protein
MVAKLASNDQMSMRKPVMIEIPNAFVTPDLNFLLTI